MPLINGYSQGRRIVAVSGGVDSMALLAASIAEFGSDQVDAIYLNHGYRAAEEIETDIHTIRSFCLRYQVSFTSRWIPVLAENRRRKDGFEAAGRLWRYKMLCHLARLRGALAVLTAHHLSDSAETVLFKIVRGSGLGLSPIRSSFIQDGVLFIRPFLSVSKSQIYAFCEREKIPFNDDLSNNDLRFSRNRIRHCVIPELEKINTNLSQGLVRFAERIGTMRDLIETLAPYHLIAKDSVDFVLSDQILTYHLALQEAVLLDVFRRIDVDPSADRIQRLLRMLDQTSVKIQLSKRWYVIRNSTGLRFTPTS